MAYKKFQGETLAEAIAQARLAYGAHVQLIDQQKMVERKGFLGIFGKKEYIEITVNVNAPAPSTKKGQPEPSHQESREAIEQLKRILEARKALSNNSSSTYSAPQAAVPPAGNITNQNDVFNEIKELKSTLEGLVNASSKASAKKSDAGYSHPVFEQIARFLEKNDFEKFFINRVIENLSVELTYKELHDCNRVREALTAMLLDELHVSQPDLDCSAGSRVIALVGPTGVGKTTSIAKIGGNLNLREDKDVVFLTMDNYRIGGSWQLEKYAEILGLPLHLIHEKEQLVEALGKNQSDFYILDTAGRNQKKELDIKAMKNYLRVIDLPLDTYLVVSATTKYNDLLDIMEKFEIMNYQKVILTKVDETNTFGSVISALSEKKKELAYICLGQSVPDDIKIAEKEDLITRVMMKFSLEKSDEILAG